MDETEQSAIRKIAWRFVPLLTIAYLFNYLDRTCLGFAALTMNKDIGLSPIQFGNGAGIFFLGYCFFEIPSNLAMYRFGARKWIARIMISWGVLSAATALVSGPNSFYLLRFLLGIAEAGFFPGITFFLAAWFPAQVRTRMLAWFLVGIPLSSVVGGPLCGLLLEMDGIWGLAGWKWLFIVVSLPCVPLGLMVLRLLADRPQSAAFLSPAERDAMDRLLAAELREKARHSVLTAIMDGRVIILAVVQLGFTLGSYGIILWLPQIMKTYQLRNLEVGLLSALPYLAATLGMLGWAWWVDRTGRRIGPLTITCFLAAVGLAIAVLPHAGFLVAMGGLTLGLIGVTSARAVFWTIPTRFLTGAAAAGGLAFINMIGTTGGYFGPALMGWLRQETGSFEAGLLAMSGIMVASTVLAASLWLVMKRE
jgi:MFS family permease